MGSSTVSFDGDAASYMALPALTCQSVGVPAPPRPNPKKKKIAVVASMRRLAIRMWHIIKYTAIPFPVRQLWSIRHA